MKGDRGRRCGPIPEAPVVQILGDAVVIRGAAAVEASRLLSRGVAAVERQDGIRANNRVLLLLSAVAEVAGMSACPVSDVRNETSSARSGSGVTHRIGTREAADLMEISERQVRRLASDLDGRIHRGRWTYDFNAVQAATANRTGD